MSDGYKRPNSSDMSTDPEHQKRTMRIDRAALAASVLSGSKPVAFSGDNMTVTLGAVPSGTPLRASIDGEVVASTWTYGDNDEATVTLRAPSTDRTTVQPLKLSGGGIDLVVDLTVLPSVASHKLAARGDGLAFADDAVWWEPFEEGTSLASWRGEGWEFAAVPYLWKTYGTNRRLQAFTRASGRVAAAVAKDAGTRTLKSPAVPLPKDGDALELRFDSHCTLGSGGSAVLNAEFGDGTQAELLRYDGKGLESTSVRLPLKAGAGSVTLSWTLKGAGASWLIDNVALVHPLPALGGGASPSDVVNIISDIQGAPERMANSVLRGLATLSGAKPQALVINGDLVPNGSDAEWRKFMIAFNSSGARERYSHIVSTVGNHELYGSEGYAAYAARFLAHTGMGNIGGAGGLWGEIVLPGGLPILWLGSEAYEYTQKKGNGPFVALSNAQFTFLADRLAHWKQQRQPVLLFSHHVLPYTVSGTYGRFYANDYGQDQDRFRALLEANPHAIVFNGHTHWDITLPDSAVAYHPNPAKPATVKTFNTGAIVNTYGPGGEWDEALVRDLKPTALRVLRFQDRVRVQVYVIRDNSAPELVATHDVPVPK